MVDVVGEDRLDTAHEVWDRWWGEAKQRARWSDAQRALRCGHAVLDEPSSIRLGLVPDSLPEQHGAWVCSDGEDSDPAGARLRELSLSYADEPPPDTLPTPVRDDREAVEAAAPAIPADDECPDDPLPFGRNQHPVGSVVKQTQKCVLIVGDGRLGIGLRPQGQDAPEIVEPCVSDRKHPAQATASPGGARTFPTTAGGLVRFAPSASRSPAQPVGGRSSSGR